jgi:hypothetical protein
MWADWYDARNPTIIEARAEAIVIRRRELVYLFVLYLAVSAAIAGGQTSREPAQSSPAPLSPQQMFRLVAPSVMVV